MRAAEFQGFWMLQQMLFLGRGGWALMNLSRQAISTKRKIHHPSFHSSSTSLAGAPHEQEPAFTSKQVTVSQALRLSFSQLSHHGIDEPDLSVTNLLASCLDLPWESGYRDLLEILNHPNPKSSLADSTLSIEQVSKFKSLLHRRLKHEPIQYIMGQWDFHGHLFEIQAPLLCPRPETEQLVEMVVKSIDGMTGGCNEAIRLLDVGSGTGCLGISIAAACRSEVLVHAIDIEPVAIKVSRRNAARILRGQRLEAYSVSLHSAQDFYNITGDEETKNALFDVVVSNPPYIPRADYEDLHPTVKYHESPHALVAGDDGMDVIRTILQRLPDWTKPGASCWMEVDPSQPSKIKNLCGDALVYRDTVKDMFGLNRFVHLKVR